MSKLIMPNGIQIELNEESRVAFITGAGISVGSGLPTYYGKDGAYTNLKHRPEDVLNDYNMNFHPEIIWDTISDIVVTGMAAKPSISHQVIADIEDKVKESLIVTQNVDDLHNKAGSKNIISMHGEAKYCICNKCQKGFNSKIETNKFIDVIKNKEVPTCPICGEARLVPNIVAFGQELNQENYFNAYDYFSKKIDVCFVIGTQIQFPYIEALLYDVRKHNLKATIIDINPDKNYYNPYADFIVRQKSDDFFEKISF